MNYIKVFIIMALVILVLNLYYPSTWRIMFCFYHTMGVLFVLSFESIINALLYVAMFFLILYIRVVWGVFLFFYYTVHWVDSFNAFYLEDIKDNLNNCHNNLISLLENLHRVGIEYREASLRTYIGFAKVLVENTLDNLPPIFWIFLYPKNPLIFIRIIFCIVSTILFVLIIFVIPDFLFECLKVIDSIGK